MKLYLVGFRGAGKSSLGKLLAQNWKIEFCDLDLIFEKKHGSIAEFVEKNGIELFRAEEEKILKTTASMENLVIATGGGVVDWPESISFLEAQKAPKVYLEVDPKLLWQRLDAPERRKVLNLQTFEQMEKLFLKREPFYHKIATLTVPCQDITLALKELESKRNALEFC